MHLTFVETLVFSARWHRRSDMEGLRALQNLLLADPMSGDPIKGCGMLRKVRFGDESRGKGKRGGVRVIYVHTPEAKQIDLVTVYGKDEADDLTPAETRLFARVLRIAAQSRARREGNVKKRRR
jgi:hypothetical protein